jgi:diguanylate cyclase (GGDEF)-like protein
MPEKDSHMKTPKEICIAFLFDEFHNEYSMGICRGAFQAARELGISVVFFGVGALESPVLYTGMRNRLFSLIDPGAFQGIMYVSSSLSNYIGAKRFLDFTGKYGTIPQAHIGIEAKGKHTFNIDNASGMYSLVDHLIVAHGRRKIAFINGTRGVHESDERFRAYRDALRDNGIGFDERYVFDGNFLRERGILAVTEFLDKRKIDIDGLVGANDQMALYAMKELQKRGYRVPDDISVGGFDDLASATSHKPALTTVHQSAAKLGYVAMQEFAGSLVEDEPRVIDTKLPAQMIVRQSCGCPEGLPEIAADDTEARLSSRMSISVRDELDSILNIMTRNILGTFEENEIRNALDENLEIFDIENFSLAKYVDPDHSMTFYDVNGTSGRNFPSRHLVEKGMGSLPYPYYKFVLPLFYRNEDIGFFVSDSGSKDLSILEVIRDHLSGALKGARLLEDTKRYAEALEKKVEERTKELETALQDVRLASEKLERLAVMDEMTGLYNRRGFMTVAKQQVELIKRRKCNAVLVFLDLDDLKHINDNFGHANGDAAIVALADILRQTFRKTDIIARLGGDEFTALAIDCSIGEYHIMLERMDNLILEYNRTSGQVFQLAVSSGAAPSRREDDFSLEQLMAEADSELYKDKKRKKVERGIN